MTIHNNKHTYSVESLHLIVSEKNNDILHADNDRALHGKQKV